MIKIVSLIILSIFSTQGGWNNLYLTLAIILPFYFFRMELFTSAIRMTFKLKWLFLSILLVYYFFSPQINHLSLALLRIFVLITIIFSVNLYLKSSTIEQILESLLWLFSPLKILNINVERISLRAVLTIEYIDVLTNKIEQHKNKISISNNWRDIKVWNSFLIQRKENLLQIIKHLGEVLKEILIETSPENIVVQAGKEYTINCLDVPSGLQLLIPIVLCLLYIYNPFLLVNF
ncbi:MAG: hypothetical protein IME94_05110 [Proteobacteria bacterium]|nr:hypothetical protein [Pseudomonadota bacterium]